MIGSVTFPTLFLPLRPQCPLFLSYSLKYMDSISNLLPSLNPTIPSLFLSSFLSTYTSFIPSIIHLCPIPLCKTALPGSRDCCRRNGGTGTELRKVEMVEEGEVGTSANDDCCCCRGQQRQYVDWASPDRREKAPGYPLWSFVLIVLHALEQSKSLQCAKSNGHGQRQVCSYPKHTWALEVTYPVAAVEAVASLLPWDLQAWTQLAGRLKVPERDCRECWTVKVRDVTLCQVVGGGVTGVSHA